MSEQTILTPQKLALFLGCDTPEGKLIGVTEWACYIGTEHISKSISIQNVKPILRKLDSMTDDEAIHIAKLSLSVKDVCFRHAIIMRHDDEINIYTHYYNTSIDEEDKDIVTIQNDFDIYISDNFFSAHNQPQIFQYLTQCQFDIFGWIDKNIALNKK